MNLQRLWTSGVFIKILGQEFDVVGGLLDLFVLEGLVVRVDDIFDIESRCFDLLVVTHFLHSTLLSEQQNLRTVFDELQLVSSKDYNLVAQSSRYAFSEHIFSNTRVNSAQRIVEQENVGFRIHSSSETDSSFLSSRNIETLVSNLCFDSFGEELKIPPHL